MREPTCWRLFSYLAIDYKAAQAELDRMAAEGWALERIHSGVLAGSGGRTAPICATFWTGPTPRSRRSTITSSSAPRRAGSWWRPWGI